MTTPPGLDAELAAALEAEPPLPSEDALTRLRAMADRVLLIDAQIAELEERLKVRKVARYELLTRDMVELMDDPSIQTEAIEVQGRRFEVADTYHASIKADAPDRDEAYAWLEDREAGDLIKYTVTATFGRDSQEQVEALETYVRQRYQDATVEVKREVPWARLTAWVKEQVLAARAEAATSQSAAIPLSLPLALLGATIGRVVELKKSKKAKGA